MHECIRTLNTNQRTTQMHKLHSFFHGVETLICPFQAIFPWAHTNASHNMYGQLGDKETWVKTGLMYFDKVSKLHERRVRPNVELIEKLGNLQFSGVAIAVTHQIPQALINASINITHPEHAKTLSKLTNSKQLFEAGYRNGCATPLAHVMQSMHARPESTAAIVMTPKDVNDMIRHNVKVCGYTGGDPAKLAQLLRAVPGPVFHRTQDFGL